VAAVADRGFLTVGKLGFPELFASPVADSPWRARNSDGGHPACGWIEATPSTAAASPSNKKICTNLKFFIDKTLPVSHNPALLLEDNRQRIAFPQA
jgi:hypothetical protein